MPQEEIRKLSQCDGYPYSQLVTELPVIMTVLTYGASGLKDIGAGIFIWKCCRCRSQRAYNGSGDEAIHCFMGEHFYNRFVEKWFDYLEKPDEMNWDGNLEIELPEYPDVTFRWYPEKMDAVTGKRNYKALHRNAHLEHIFLRSYRRRAS